MFPHHDSVAQTSTWLRRNRAVPSPSLTGWAAQPRTISIICGMDGRAHEVTEQDVAAGRQTGNRQYRAICGYRFMLPAPLVALAGRPCAKCAAVLAGATGHVSRC